ncbi:phage holin family protein [Azotobacter salinestris]|uniref:phage holin family protein n=1 Tax=Azotobacter salinestris TaxID=69964 RepID=UPI001266CA22|nr:phage holin family protein [Azotobacter salinestris]
MDVSPPPLSGEDRKPSLKRFGGALLGLLQNHLELLGIEFQEEKAYAFRLFIFASLSLLFGLMLLIGLSAAVVVVFWDSHRLAAIFVLCLAYGLALVFCIARTLKLAQRSEHPFQATLEELARNRELLP